MSHPSRLARLSIAIRNDKDSAATATTTTSTRHPRCLNAMPTKRRRSSTSERPQLPISKRTRTRHPDDHLDSLSDELLIHILQLLPLETIIQCQRLSRRFYTLAGDSQIWKSLYYTRFVLPRALRIPGIRTARDDLLNFSSKKSRWLSEDALVNPVDGKETNWKGQYKLRHNWSIGACDIQEIHVADRAAVPSMQVKLAEKVVVTTDKEGLRAWGLRDKELIAKYPLGGDLLPSCLAVDELHSENGLGIAVGFVNGGWGVWRLDTKEKKFVPTYRHPESSNGKLGAIAYAHPYVLTITDSQRLSLYTFDLEQGSTVPDTNTASTPRLLASLQSHTSWPPLSLSLRPTSSYLIASIAYSLPVYPRGYTVGIQELHLSPVTGIITSSRLASALPQGFTSISATSASVSPERASPSSIQHSPAPPTSLSYAHPYILTTHSDNTLALHLCTSTASALSLSPATRLWGHTTSVVAAQITPRGKAVSVSSGTHVPSANTRRESYGGELRIWDLEGSHVRRRRERSVKVGSPGSGKRWVGFDEEVVVVLEEEAGLVLTVHDFT